MSRSKFVLCLGGTRGGLTLWGNGFRNEGRTSSVMSNDNPDVEQIEEILEEIRVMLWKLRKGRPDV